MYGLTLILTLAVVGGLIAYIGDRIGMKIGRKRLTLFGLRPKHTSILVTIVTGILIAASSIAVLSIASQDVRTALFRMKEIQETLAVSQSRLEESMRRVQNMETTLAAMTAERDEAAEQLAEVHAEVELQQERVDTYQALSEKLEVKVEDLEGQRQELEGDIEFLVDEFYKLYTDYVSLYEDYVRFSYELTEMRAGNVAFRADEIIYADILSGGRPVDNIADDVTAFLEQANAIALARGAQVDDDEDQAIQLRQETFDGIVHALHLQEGDYVVRVVSMNNSWVGEPVATYMELIADKLLFRQGDIVADVTIDMSETADVDKHIVGLIGEANRKAIAAGMITSPDGGAVEVAGDEFIAAISTIQGLQGHEGTISIQAAARTNTRSTEGPMPLSLEVIPH